MPKKSSAAQKIRPLKAPSVKDTSGVRPAELELLRQLRTILTRQNKKIEKLG